MDRLNTGHAGQRPDICSFVRDALAGQDRTPPYKGVRMSGVCPFTPDCRPAEPSSGGTRFF